MDNFDNAIDRIQEVRRIIAEVRDENPNYAHKLTECIVDCNRLIAKLEAF